MHYYEYRRKHMTYFLYDGFVYSCVMTDFGLAVYNSQSEEVTELVVVEAAYEAFERKVA
jgi:hypothetical protein